MLPKENPQTMLISSLANIYREYSVVCIGLCNKNVRLDSLPGWNKGSWAYHGDDGRIFSGIPFSRTFGPTFGTNDVVGCGLVSRHREFFTKNGHLVGKLNVLSSLRKPHETDRISGVLELKTKSRLRRLYPMVGMKERGVIISANFGSSPFRYDLARLRLLKTKIENEGRGRWPIFRLGESDYNLDDYEWEED